MSGEKSGFPDQAAAAYPPEGTSTAAYPPEGTSAAAYPPAQYPAQTQPAAYPPPAYAPAKREENVTTVVVTQPQARPVYIQRSSNDYGSSATILAVCTTAFMLICGCWWSLPCTIAAVVLGITSSAAVDDESARKRSHSSVACSVAGWVFAVVGLAILIGIAFGLNGSATVTTTSSRTQF